MAEHNPAGNPEVHGEHSAGEDVNAAGSHLEAGARHAMREAGLEREGPSIAAVTLVGVGVALIEPELIPGMLLGAGALLAPKVLPAVGKMLRPMVKGVVKAGYSAAVAVREAVAEAGEQIEDMVAEARAEHEAGDGHHTPEEHTAAPEPQKRQRRAPRTTPVPDPNV